MTWLAYALGVITLPTIYGLVIGTAWALSRDGSTGVQCDNCARAGYRTGRYRDREVFAIEQWAIRAWHRHVVARRRGHRIAWQADFDALGANSLRREWLAMSQSKYGVRS